MKMLKQTFIFTLMLLTVATFCPTNSFGDGVAETVTDPSLILWLSFDELDGNRVIDHSQHGNHGTVVGNRQLAAGWFGNALTFDGVSDWVEIPHHESLTVDTSVTVMAWIHTPRSHGPHGSNWQGIIAKNNDFRSYSLYTATGDLVHLSVGENLGAGSSATNRTFALNTWQHVAAQVDSNGVQRYWINGESAGTFQLGNTLPGLADTASVLVGKTHEDNREFLGMIDEIRVWNRALSEAEILEQMAIGYGGGDPPVTGVYMYWADFSTNTIQRANLDGTNVQGLVPGFGRPVGIALDISGGKMYFTDRNAPDLRTPGAVNSIHRANLDGTNIETILPGSDPVKEAIALDISGGKMYWAEYDGVNEDHKIRRANLDGTNVEDLITEFALGTDPIYEGPRGIALDLSMRKMYWTNLAAGKIHRANLDGTNVEDLITGLTLPHHIALDFSSGKIYWSDHLDGKIQCANFDGTNVEDLVGGLRNPAGIALDVARGKMYWTDAGAGKIQRANLDGSNVEDLVSGLGRPTGLALGISQILSGLRFDPNMIADQTFTVGTDVSLNLPVATGGTEPYAYTLTPDPPAGLQFDAIDRSIGGTPTTPMQTTPYTYTATDINGGTASLAFTITVTNASALENGLFAEVYRPGYTLTQLPDFQTLTPFRTFTLTNLDLPARPCEQGFPGVGIDIIEDFAIRFRGQLNIVTPDTYNFAIDVDDGAKLYINGSLIIDHDGLNTLARENPGRGSVTLTAGLHEVEVQYFQGPCSHLGLQWFWQPPGGTEEIVPADVLYLPDTPPGSGISFNPSMIANQTFTVGTSVDLTLPTATGGSAPYTYTLFPIPDGLDFDAAAQRLTGAATTVGTTQATYAATDATGVSAALIFTITVEEDSLNLDVNGNGKVNVIDLVLVAAAYGERGTGIPADVNADGIVNIQDLIAVAAGIDASGAALPQAVKEALVAEVGDLKAVAEAPRGFSTAERGVAGIIYSNVADALADVKHLATGDVRLVKWVPLLEELLHLLTEMREIPDTTALLPNYPNPFNPETWIPYHLATDAEVMLTIYNTRGIAVRTLTLGHQPAGVYQSKHRAAYWDGRNDEGEKVSSGVYFYTLTAGDFTATRKLLIIK